ncbi:MAG: TIGR00730 family Rossman fold protein [Muribaculaceae bacterium]
MNIAVYCSSRPGLPDEYTSVARAVGRWIGEGGHTLVYGGVDAGMMHTVAQAAHDAGAHIIGIVPRCFAHRADSLVDELKHCINLSDRKALMIGYSDMFVVLPGGLGTIDEWISTLSQLVVNADTHRKIVVANIGGLFDSTVSQIAMLAASPLARSEMLQMSLIATSETETITLLNWCVNQQ